MGKTRFFKVLALINFIALLTIFVFWGDGLFGGFFENGRKFNSPNGGAISKVAQDTLFKKVTLYSGKGFLHQNQ